MLFVVAFGYELISFGIQSNYAKANTYEEALFTVNGVIHAKIVRGFSSVG